MSPCTNPPSCNALTTRWISATNPGLLPSCNKTGRWPALFLTLSVLLLYADGATQCVPYSTIPYSLLWGCGPTLLYVHLTLHDPILGCGHTLSLHRCGDCLICVFLILYLYNVVGGDCGPHFVFTPRILHVTCVSKSLLTLPLLVIITT